MTNATWSQVPERGSFGAMALGIRALNTFGYSFGRFVGFLAVLYFFLTNRTTRKASREYLTQLKKAYPDGPDPSLANTFRHHWQFGNAVMDRMYFWQGKTDHFTFSKQGSRSLLKALDKGRGVLLIGGHFGSFDAMRAFSRQKGLRLKVVMYQQNAAKINALFRKLDPGADLEIVNLDGTDMTRIFALKEYVDNGDVVAILADRRAPYGNRRNTLAPFLGAAALFPQNPWILAHLLACPVFFAAGYCIGKRRYHVRVKQLSDQIHLPRASRQTAVVAFVKQFAAEMEALCRDFPFQWFNFYPFWQTGNDGQTNKDVS